MTCCDMILNEVALSRLVQSIAFYLAVVEVTFIYFLIYIFKLRHLIN